MQRCNRCHISVHGNKRCCPLCEGTLTGEPDSPGFPVLKRAKLAKLSLLKMGAFLFFAFEIVMFALDFLAGGKLSWVPLAMLAAVVAFVDLLLVIYLRNNFLKMFTIEVYVAMIICLVTDKLTGYHGWSVIWVIPCSFVGMIVVTICAGKGMEMLLGDYIIYLAIDTVLSLLQIIFIAVGWNDFPFPAVISLALIGIGAVAALFFRFRTLKHASEKMFHI